MTLTIIGGVLFGLAGAGGGLAGSLIQLRMVDDVNQQLPAAQRFGTTWWTLSKTRRLFQAYRALCPNGTRLRRLYAVWTWSGACAAIGLVLFLLGPRYRQ